MTDFFKFPSIKAFQNRVVQGSKVPHDKQCSVVFPKLHGTNAAIGVFEEGVTAQSRNRLLTIHNDNAGFANFVETLDINNRSTLGDLIFFGEWCGGNVQKGGDAICQVSDKYFVIFGVYSFETDLMVNGWEIMEKLVEEVLGNNDHIIVMKPLDTIYFSFSQNDEFLQGACDAVNKYVEEHETVCAFTKEHFGIEAPGEGVVVSPLNAKWCDYEAWTFKAKTDAHAVNKSTKPAMVKMTTSEDVLEFVDRYATEARFKQAVSELDIEYDMRNTGTFLKWVMNDIHKESSDEREESGLDWKEAVKPITAATKVWFTSKVNGK